MQHTDLPSSWAKALESLQLHRGQSQPPSGETTPWYAPIMRFGKKGFLLLFLTAREEQEVTLRLEILLPTQALAAQTLDALTARLTQVEGIERITPLQEQPQPHQPALLNLHTRSISEEDARDILLLLLKLGDHVVALDTNPDAPSPLSAGNAKEAEEKASSPQEDTQASTGGSVGTSASASPFESIGAPTPRDEAPPGDKRARLRSFHLRATSTHHLELELEMDQSTRDARALIQSISRNIATRFDAHVDSVRHNPNPVLELRPAISKHTQADVDRLHKDTCRYMERLTTIDQAGISLDLILGADAPPSGEMSQQSSRDEMRRTRRDIPSSQFTAIRPSSGGPPTQPATEQHNTGFVLAIEPDPRDTTTSGADEAPQRVELAAQLRTTLRQGDFTDERLRREDAESALVDVVLRHPGYSDKNMAKVLTLLLSVDYSQALSIISLAPCVLARGTGQERARTMKSVIEGAGGKVVLVEPDTFAIA